MSDSLNMLHKLRRGGSPDSTPSDSMPPDPLRGALLDSRQRWLDLVSLAADLAFETDAAGRFVFLTPEIVLGWPVATLLGQPGELLLSEGGLEGEATAAAFNPFRPVATIRRRRAWLKRADKSVACLSFATAPLFDAQGRIIGARGIAIDMSDQDEEDARIAATLRRCEVMDHILWLMRQEVLAPRMMQAVLQALENALGAEGAAVMDILASEKPGGDGKLLLHRSGGGAEALEVAVTAAHLMQAKAMADRDLQRLGATA